MVLINANVPVRIRSYTLLQIFYLIQNYMTSYLYVDIIIHIFQTITFNFSIRYIWINSTYIILNLCYTIFQLYRVIGKTLGYHKRSHIWRFIFLRSFSGEHKVISNFIVVVNSISIFADVIFIDLCLLLLMKYLPIHRTFY